MSNRELSEGINLRNLVLESENPFIDSDIYLIIRNKNRHKKMQSEKENIVPRSNMDLVHRWVSVKCEQQCKVEMFVLI
jgi:hypothetical protein